MVRADVADANAGFEFNPSAPEFVPHQHVAWLGGLPASLCTADLDGQPWKVGNGLDQEPPKPPRRSRKGSARSEGPDLVTAEAADKASERGRRPAVRRSATSAMEMPSQVATLVVKNLALDLEKDNIVRFLEEQGVAPVDAELHLDANGAFRGTAFVRYGSPGKARAALQKLGTCPELGGRKARVEVQKSKTLIGRRCLEAELPQEELGIVREEIDAFLKDDSCFEIGLPTTFTVHQRKYAHSLAERHSLMHVTRQGDNGEKYVHLSKARRNQESLKANSLHGGRLSRARLPFAQAQDQADAAWAAVIAGEGARVLADEPMHVGGHRGKAHSAHFPATPLMGPLESDFLLGGAPGLPSPLLRMTVPGAPGLTLGGAVPKPAPGLLPPGLEIHLEGGMLPEPELDFRENPATVETELEEEQERMEEVIELRLRSEACGLQLQDA